MPDDKYRKKNWKGTLISVVAIVVSLIVVVGCLLGGYIGYKNYTKNHKKKSTAAQQETQLSGQIESVQQTKKRWFQQRCRLRNKQRSRRQHKQLRRQQ